jgi:hypothetical protein
LPHHYAKCALQTHTHRIAAAATPSLQLPDGYKSVHVTSAYLHHYSIEFLVTPANVGMKDPFEMVVLAGSIQEAMSDSARAVYRKTAIQFDGVIKKHGGRTALLWLPAVVKANLLADSDMFGKTQDMMLSVGNEMGALIIPVGLAYKEAYRQRPDIKLQMDYDSSHPTVAGQYLAAPWSTAASMARRRPAIPTTTLARSTRTRSSSCRRLPTRRCRSSSGANRARD